MKSNKEMADIARQVIQGGVKPITVQFNNTNDGVIPTKTNLILFYPRRNLGRANQGLPSGVTATTNSGITYEDLLNDIMVNPFKVKYTYIHSTTTSKLPLTSGDIQVLNVLEIIAKDVTGNTKAVSINPVVDPYQNRGNVLFTDDEYVIDKDTTILLPEMPSKTTYYISFYPAEAYETGKVAPKIVNNEKKLDILSGIDSSISADGNNDVVSNNKIEIPMWSKCLFGITVFLGLSYIGNKMNKS